MMDHEYVVSLHCAFQDKVNLYMVLDYAGGGDMFALIDKRCGPRSARAPQPSRAAGLRTPPHPCAARPLAAPLPCPRRSRRLPEDWVRIYAAELVLALEHCHAKGIVYRDLKPENVMITLDGHVLLTDFGLSKKLGDPSLPDDKLRTRTVCGTPSYMAPEALSGRPYGRAVDWWTLGCVIYEMAVGAQPFAADALAALVRKVTSGSYQVRGARCARSAAARPITFRKPPSPECSPPRARAHTSPQPSARRRRPATLDFATPCHPNRCPRGSRLSSPR